MMNKYESTSALVGCIYAFQKYEVTDLGSALKMFAALLIPAEKGPM